MEKLSYNNKKVIFLSDTETEGLNLLTSRPWQIAWNKTVNGKLIDEQERYIWWPDLEVSAGAAAITKFDYNKYKKLALPAEEVWEEFSPLLYDESFILAGHNFLAFDLPIIQTWAKRINKWRGWTGICERILDSLLIGRMWNDGRQPDRENMFSSQIKEVGKPPRGSKKCTLSALADAFGIKYEKERLHDAKYDIWLNAQVINQLIYKMDL